MSYLVVVNRNPGNHTHTKTHTNTIFNSKCEKKCIRNTWLGRLSQTN